jgi:uncharacterized protein (TIGR00255 family)
VIRSMTGFGRAELAHGEIALGVEVRTVNSRHLDVRVRLPRELQSAEAMVRECASGVFGRGQVDLQVRALEGRALEPRLEIDLATARSYTEAVRTLRAELGLASELSVGELLALPGVSRLREPALADGALLGALEQAVREACKATAAMRQREGEALDQELRRRLRGLEALLEEVERRADEIRGGLRARLEKRLAALAPDVEVNAGRLEQEVVLFADRMDVTEETVRLRSHLEQFRETLETEGPVGRKLEFLLQELGREINTIGSKASDGPIGRCVVELKTELEKLREQVLNVE